MLLTVKWYMLQDWARLHGYEMHVMAAATDVRIRPGPWQKIAMIRQVSVWQCGLSPGLIAGRVVINKEPAPRLSFYTNPYPVLRLGTLALSMGMHAC